MTELFCNEQLASNQVPTNQLPLVNFPRKIPASNIPTHAFKYSHPLVNWKIEKFLLKGKLDSRSNICNVQQSDVRKSKMKWYA